MFTDALLPDVFRPIIERFKAVFRPLDKGSLTADMAELSLDFASRLSFETDKQSKATPTPRPLREALRRWVAQQPGVVELVSPTLVSYGKRIEISGTTYRPRNIALGDSFILVGTEADWEPAQICSIFSTERLCESGRGIVTLLSVSRFRPLSADDVVFDKYRAFPYAGGRIYYSEGLPEEVISQGEVLSHFAYTPGVCEKITKTHFHALPLTRVWFLSSFASSYPCLTTSYRAKLFFVFPPPTQVQSQ